MKEEIKKLFTHIEKRIPSNKHFYMIWFNHPLKYELFCDLTTMECKLNPKEKPFLSETFHISKATDKICALSLDLNSLIPELEKHIFAPILYKEMLEKELESIMPDFKERYDAFAGFYRSLPEMVSKTIEENNRNKLKVIKEDSSEE